MVRLEDLVRGTTVKGILPNHHVVIVDVTQPLRTGLSNRMRGQGSNALAASIVLVCRPRPTDAPSTTRRRFVDELKSELPDALKKLQQGNIAPVDLAQASIGPGMAIAYNSLVISWSEIARLALEVKQPTTQQLDLI
jgi:adenine-specific DNA methylase